jgi:hypothetical protein
VITGQHADGRRFEQKLTKRTKKVRIDQKDLVQLDLAALAELPALTELYVRSEQLTGLSLVPLAGTSLAHLKLIVDLPTLDLASLVGLPLTELTISGGPPALDLAPLATCTTLTDLLIFDGPLATIDLAPLAGCTALRVMWLRSLHLGELDLRPLAQLPDFQAAVLDRSRLTSVTLGDTGFAALTHLDVSHNPLETATLGVLATSRTLKSLRIPRGFTLSFERDEIVRV